MTVHNPRWLQIIFYLAILGSPLLAGYIFFLGITSFQSSIVLGLTTIFIAFCVAYMSYIGIRLAKFVPVKVTFDDQQFHVAIENVTTTYQWSDVSSIRRHKMLQTLELLNEAGEIIYAVDYLTPGYKEFADKLKESVVS